MVGKSMAALVVQVAQRPTFSITTYSSYSFPRTPTTKTNTNTLRITSSCTKKNPSTSFGFSSVLIPRTQQKLSLNYNNNSSNNFLGLLHARAVPHRRLYSIIKSSIRFDTCALTSCKHFAQKLSLLLLSAMSWKILIVLLIGGFLAWAYQALCPPSPRICGSPGGPPIEAPRIKLRDGRHLAYKEHGVPKETAKYKIILVHGFGSSRHEAAIATSELVEKLGIYIVTFDRPGYGQSDPDPQRTIKSTALDIEELGNQLGLGSKFHIIGISMGGQVVWGCLKYISHRLAGAALVAPVVNYWWPSFPAALATEAYSEQFLQDQWALRVAHHAPWLVYWWNTQKLFPASSVASGRPNFTAPDLKVIGQVGGRMASREYTIQQGEYESLHRDMRVGFGHWEFDPMELENPFSDGDGSVHLWQGDEDGLVPVTLQRYISSKLPWINYHELPNAGHLFAYADKNTQDAILKKLLIGDK